MPPRYADCVCKAALPLRPFHSESEFAGLPCRAASVPEIRSRAITIHLKPCRLAAAPTVEQRAVLQLPLPWSSVPSESAICRHPLSEEALVFESD